MSKKRILGIVAVAVVLMIVVGCGAYVGDYYHADETASAAMVSSESVTVQTTRDGTLFLPEDADTGFIFYPGGKVEYTAYAPLMRALAEENILCVLVEMPFNLAVLDMDAAKGISEQYPEIESWYIGGHSLGGSMAASYLADHAEDYRGLVLLASYSTADLSDTQLQVVSIYGSEDGVLNQEKYEENQPNLPESALKTVIIGGNHAGFGSYGPQDGDGQATISPAEQTRTTAEQLLQFFEK